MTQNARVRINLSSREFEVEGSEDFVNNYLDTIDNLLDRLLSSTSSSNTIKDTPNPFPGGTSQSSLPKHFGDLFAKVPSNISDADCALLAGWFIQNRNYTTSDENEDTKNFTTGEVTETLLTVNKKLSNTSQAIQNNINSKRVFALSGSKGKKFYRVSNEGEQVLKELLKKS